MLFARHSLRASLVFCSVIGLASVAWSDDKLDAMVRNGKYKEAIQYADEKLPVDARDVGVWVKIGEAQLRLGAKDKAQAAFEAAQKTNPSDARVALGFGMLSLEDKKYQDALDNYQHSYVLDRTGVAAEGIAVCASRLKQFDKARDAAESAINLDPALLDSRLILSEIYMKDQDFKNAALQLEVICEKKPTDVKLWKQLAVCYEKTGDARKLSDADRKIVDLDKKDVSSRRRLAEFSLEAKDSSTAFDLCRELAILTPKDAKVFKLLYQIASNRANKKDATLYLKNFLLLDSTVALSHKALGDLLYEQGDFDGALESYRRALKLDPQIKGFFKRYESIVLKKGLEDEAVRVIRAGIAAGEADAASQIALGDILKKRKEFGDAIKAYQDALKTDASNVGVLTSLGECQAANGDVPNAIITYEQVVLMNGKAVQEIKTLGDLQIRNKKTDNAMATYKKYLAKASDDAEIARTVGLNEFGKKQYGEALKFLTMVRDVKLQDAEYLQALGESYFRTGEFKSASATLEKIRALKPAPSILQNALSLLGQAYEKTGDDQKAAEAYEAYVGLPGVKDGDAAYMMALLREKTDKKAAVLAYQNNTKAYPKDYRNFLQLGVILSIDKASLARAAGLLSSASVLIDTLPVVWQKLGEVNGKLGNEADELAAYQKLLKMQPQDLDANKRVGQILMKKGQTQSAITSLETALTLSPKDADVMLLLAEGYIKTKRPGQAADLLKKARELRPDDVQVRLTLIDMRNAANQKDQAEKERDELSELDKKIADKNKKDITSRQRLAQYYLDRKDAPKAYDTHKELAILTPNDPKVFKNLYEVALDRGNRKDAVLYLKNFLVLDSSDASYVKALGDLLYDEKDLDGALEAYRKALRLDAKAKGFYKKYESIVLQKKLEDEATRVITGAIAAGEADASSYIALGQIYQKRGNCPGAIKMYQEALKTDTKNVVVMTSLADCQAKAADAGGAVITYEQVVLMNPQASTEYKALGDLQQKMNKMDAATGSYKKYLAKVPTDEAVARSIGLYEFGRKQYSEAVKYLEMVRDAKLQDIGYQDALGQAYYYSGNYARASEVLAKLDSMKPPASVGRVSLKLLAEAYIKNGKEARAAEAYDSYTAVAGVKDPDASYLRAFLREKTDVAAAVRIYESNTKFFSKDYRSFLRLGSIYAEDKATQGKAAAMLSAASQLVDTLPDMWATMGQVYGKLGDENKELGAYQKLLKLDPQNFEANRRVGAILLKQGQTQSAIAKLEAAYTMAPNDAEIMLLLADGYLKTKRPQQAAELLGKAKAVKSDDPGLRVQLYRLYKDLGQMDKAEEEIKQLVSMTKDNKYRTIYADDLIEQSRYDEAVKLVKEINASAPSNIAGLMLLAKVQRGQMAFGQAIETYKAIGFIDEKFLPAVVERANAYLQMNELARAQEYFEKALKANAKSVGALVGLSRVAKAKNDKAGQQKYLGMAKAIDPRDPDVVQEIGATQPAPAPQADPKADPKKK
jgi:tetratricopeptide (TPR) repeat protein